jgi:protease-4
MRPSPLLLAALLSSQAWAQTHTISHADPSKGTKLPPTSAAIISDATSTAVNPAGLTFSGSPQLFYLHERSINRGQVIDGLYLGSSLFRFLGVGASIEWVRSDLGLDYRKTAYGASLGSNGLSLGFAYNVFSSAESTDLDALSSWDIGAITRPSRYFSLAAVVKNVDSPSRGTIDLQRTWDFALGLRPAGERYTLGVDYLLPEVGGAGAGRFNYTAQAEVVSGVILSAGVSHGLRSGDPLLFQFAATLNGGNFGVTYAGGGGAGASDHVVAVRLSRQNYRAIDLIPDKVAMFDMDDLLSERGNALMSVLGLPEDDPYLKLTKLLDTAARDANLKAVVLKVATFEGGMGKAEELRQAVLRLQAAGKKVIALVLSADDAEYHFISSADRIYAVPEAMLMIDGFIATPTFLGGTMEKLGVTWDVARSGPYKNAPDQLTRTGLSPEHRESIEAYLDTDQKVFEAAVAKGRGMSVEQVRAAVNEGLKTPARAKKLGLIDEVLSPDQLGEKLVELAPGARFDPQYRPQLVREDRWGGRRRIAVVPVIGNISGGKSREDPLGVSKIAGAETVIRAIAQARADPSVAAIVIRVDSGGGDGLASDLMYRAVLEAKKEKPVVASMGDVAASGGYYAAMGTQEIFAEPTTITGSIGVFFIKPAVQGLAQKLGVNQEAIRRGTLAGTTNLFSPWTDAERASVQGWVNAFYEDFIQEVAKSRNMTRDQVHAVAQGRVWSGEDAKARGLVDTMGGLLEAIDAARRRAGIPENEDIEILLLGEPRSILASAAGEEGVFADLLARAMEPTANASALPPTLKQVALELGADRLLTTPTGLMTMMEYSLSVR